MNIALIVHRNPQTLREARGLEGREEGGHVVSSSEMVGGKKKYQHPSPSSPCNRHGGGKRWSAGGGRGENEGVY